MAIFYLLDGRVARLDENEGAIYPFICSLTGSKLYFSSRQKRHLKHNFTRDVRSNLINLFGVKRDYD